MHEFWEILNVLSLYKVWNALKLRVSYQLAGLNSKIKIWGLPESVSIEPTTQCNLYCSECPAGQRNFTRPTGMIDFELFVQIIEQSKKHLIYLLLYFQGEPYLHPLFFKMVKYARKQKIYVATSTNGHYLSKKNALRTVKSGLNKLLVSLDGTNQEVYEKYRKGGDFNKVVQGIKNLVEAKKELNVRNPQIVLQFIVFKHNQHQIEAFKQLAKELKVDKYELKTAQIYDYKNGNRLIPDLANYSRYEQQDENYKIKSLLPNGCWRMWHSVVITQSGQMVPCCFDKQAEHCYSVLSESMDFKTAFYSLKAQEFRRQVFSQRASIAICRNCSEGLL